MRGRVWHNLSGGGEQAWNGPYGFCCNCYLRGDLEADQRACHQCKKRAATKAARVETAAAREIADKKEPEEKEKEKKERRGCFGWFPKHRGAAGG